MVLISNRFMVDLLIVVFGISSWVSINGLWVQTPLLVKSLPEQWDLASYIVVLTQTANIGPILYTLVKKAVSSSHQESLETWSIHLVLALGFSSCVLLSFLWNVTVRNISLPFFILTTISAMVDCTSSLLYFPFVRKFRLSCLRSLLIGEALSGLIPSLVALVQGVGGNPSCVNVTKDGNTTIETVYPDPLFSVNSFFIFLSFLMFLSWAAYSILRHSSIGNAYQLSPCNSETNNECLNNPGDNRNYGINEHSSSNTDQLSTASHSEINLSVGGDRRIQIYLVLQAYYCLLGNGICAAIQTYSSLPYGNTTHHLATSLSAASGPIAVIFCFFIHSSNRNFAKSIVLMTILSTLTAVYIIVLALMSPNPPFLNSSLGPILIISCWITFHACNTYARSSIAGHLKLSPDPDAMFKYGFATQLGSFIGAVTIFTIMQVFKPFHSYHPC